MFCTASSSSSSSPPPPPPPPHYNCIHIKQSGNTCHIRSLQAYQTLAMNSISSIVGKQNTVEYQYNKILGTSEINLLY